MGNSSTSLAPANSTENGANNQSLPSAPPFSSNETTSGNPTTTPAAIISPDLEVRQSHSMDTSLINTNSTLANNATTLLGNQNFSSQSNQDEHEFSVNLFGTVLYPFRWLTLTNLTSWLGPISSAAMIVGCVLPYVPQYATIRKSRSCSGFSTFVCLTLLVANILRIAFWFGHPFELPLLIQSIIMVIAQIALLELCVRVKSSTIKRSIWKSHPRFFWRWTNLASYLEFILIFTILLAVAVYLFIENKLFIETLGYCALVSESMLGLPQVIKNFRKKSVEGMSLSMVLMWLAGDTFKTGYFIANKVPFQFWLCGLLQITIDVIILLQVCLYRQNAPMKRSPTPKEMVAL